MSELTPARGTAQRRRFLTAALAGSIVALIADALMLGGQHHDLLRSSGALGSFFDTQGHAILHGRLNVDPRTVSIEGFVVGGKTYIYFGPFPALLRLPVLVFTHRFDGRLTQLSMLCAFVVLLWSGALLQWRLRSVLRREDEVSRTDLAAAALFQFALGAGAVPLFLASSTIVYHETELWGAAWTLAAVEAIVRVMMRPGGRRVAWAGVATAFAVNSRVSIGLGPVIALAFLAGSGAVARAAARGEHPRLARLGVALWSFGSFTPRPPSRRLLAGLVAAALVPMLVYVAINEARFHQPFGIPLYQQVNTRLSPLQRRVLDDNHGSLFGAKYVRTTLLQAIRPDAVGSVRAFPFVTLPHAPPKRVGGELFEKLQRSLSAPTSMPLFFVLALCGIAQLRRRRLRPLLSLTIATVIGYLPALAIAFVTTRYLADLLPALVLCAAVGLHSLLRAFRSRRARAGVLGVTTLLCFAGTVTNGGAGLTAQRLGGGQPEADRAAFVRTEDDIDRFLGRRPTGVREGARLPPGGTPGDLFIVGRCDAMFVADTDGYWIPVERTPAGGLHRLRVAFPASTHGRPEALLTVGRGAARVTVVVNGAGSRFAISLERGGKRVTSDHPITVASPRDASIELRFDPLAGSLFAVLRVDRRAAGATIVSQIPRGDTLGADPDDSALPPFGGLVRENPLAPTVCRRIARRSGLTPGGSGRG